MGSPLIKRLDALYQRAQMVMKVQADHAPFLYVAPWSFMKNECRVKYFPEGTYQEEEKITTTFHNALAIAQYYYECGIHVQFTMSLCIEWLSCFLVMILGIHQNNKKSGTEKTKKNFQK